MDRHLKFWDRIARRYARQPVADEASYQRKLDITREYLQADMQLLEIGCGTGSTAIVHAPFVKHIRAVDVSANMIAIAKQKAAELQINNIDFEQALIDDVQVETGSVDVVLALSILHLLDDKESVIKRIYSMLKPGGLFISNTACLGDFMKFYKYFGPIGSFLGVLPLVKVFSEAELLDCIQQAGFTIEQHWCPGRAKAVFVVARK